MIRVHLVADFRDVSAVSRRGFPSVFSMASVSRLLQPGQSRSYEQTLRLGALREELHIWRDSAGNCPGSLAWRAWVGGAFPQPAFRLRRSCLDATQ